LWDDELGNGGLLAFLLGVVVEEEGGPATIQMVQQGARIQQGLS
jgi:hypothetical protein